MYKDLMIDLETLSTRHDAAIISIGACYFDIETGEIGNTFYQTIAMKDSPYFGHISADTVRWWLTQNQAARDAVSQPNGQLEINDALAEFDKFRLGGSKLWSNGSSFDMVILRNAYARCLWHKTPWEYWEERDTRTIVDLCERITGINTAKTTDFTGARHNALNDAIFQAQYVSTTYQLLSRMKYQQRVEI